MREDGGGAPRANHRHRSIKLTTAPTVAAKYYSRRCRNASAYARLCDSPNALAGRQADIPKLLVAEFEQSEAGAPPLHLPGEPGKHRCHHNNRAAPRRGWHAGSAQETGSATTSGMVLRWSGFPAPGLEDARRRDGRVGALGERQKLARGVLYLVLGCDARGDGESVIAANVSGAICLMSPLRPNGCVSPASRLRKPAFSNSPASLRPMYGSPPRACAAAT